MSARFVSLAVAYSLGTGKLSRKGVRQRPWLEMRRLETESTYLEHQVRALRRSVRQAIRVEEDDLPGTGYYDITRVRIQSPFLDRAVELLEQGVSSEALQVAGLRGIACLWLDRGRWKSGRAEISLDSAQATSLVHHAICQLSIPCPAPSGNGLTLRLAPQAMHDLASILRPFVHRTMRHTLRPGSRHGSSLLE